MDIYSFLQMAGGLAFFLYGMHVLSDGLEKMAGGNLEGILKSMTSTKFKGLMLGTVMTIALQSSSTLTVILVGLVNSGMISVENTIGVILGSHIGTTFTAWILSLAGIESTNIIMGLLKPKNLGMILSVIGIIFTMTSKKQNKKDLGYTLIGFGILMYGMTVMSSSVSPLTQDPSFRNILVSFTNPILGLLVGTVFTGIIQSSAASIGILQAFALTGNITWEMAIPIIMGLNIGTCVTAVLSSIGVNTEARKVSFIHISTNIIGAIICMVIFFIVKAMNVLPFMNEPITVFGIALFHSIYNIFNTIIIYPFTGWVKRLADTCVKAKKSANKEMPLVDSLLMRTPSVAVSQCDVIGYQMAQLALDTVTTAISDMTYTEDKAKAIIDGEEKLDRYEDALGTALVRLAGKQLSESDSDQISKMLHVITDYERMGDHSLNVLDIAKNMHDKNIEFSDDAANELTVITNAVLEILGTSIKSYINSDRNLAKTVEPLEQVIDGLCDQMKSNHIERLKKGLCNYESGFAFNDILTNYERISDHCSNIAVAVIEVGKKNFDAHEYINRVKATNKNHFKELYSQYSQKYSLSKEAEANE